MTSNELTNWLKVAGAAALAASATGAVAESAGVHPHPVLMGVLNVTPDSFSDGGRFGDISAAADEAVRMIEAGADWIDVGGESTRPGASRISADEQIGRTVPVIVEMRRRSAAVISIDTTLSAVARAALDVGADMVNDISAGRDDPEMFGLVAGRKVPIILMHMKGTSADMQRSPAYDDVTAEVCEFLRERRQAAGRAGVAAADVLLDPGLGFGKTVSHNLRLVRDTRILAGLGSALLVGPSRKNFIGQVTGEPQPDRRVFGTAAAVGWAVARGAAVVRVHDIGPMRQVVRMVRAIAQSENVEAENVESENFK